MTARYFVDGEGSYIGGFVGVEPPEGAIEVPSAPDHAGRKWMGNKWGAKPDVPHESPVEKLERFLADNPDVAALING